MRSKILFKAFTYYTITISTLSSTLSSRIAFIALARLMVFFTFRQIIKHIRPEQKMMNNTRDFFQIFSFTFSLAYGDRNIEGEFTLGSKTLDGVAICSSFVFANTTRFLVTTHVDVWSQVPPAGQLLSAVQGSPSLPPPSHLQQSTSAVQACVGAFEQTGVGVIKTGVDGLVRSVSLRMAVGDVGISVGDFLCIVGKTCCETAKEDESVDGTSEGWVLIEDTSIGGDVDVGVGKPISEG